MLEEINEEPVKVGEVYLDHEIVISDPCYEDGTWCAGKYELPTQGVYDCYYTLHSEYHVISSIWVVLHGLDNAELSAEIGQEIGTCGVDSGQLGIFNQHRYRKAVTEQEFKQSLDHKFRYEDWKREWNEDDQDEDKFYKAVCNLTLGEERLGILDGVGFVSSSGFGDGVYPVYELLDEDGYVIGVRIDFAVEDED